MKIIRFLIALTLYIISFLTIYLTLSLLGTFKYDYIECITSFNWFFVYTFITWWMHIFIVVYIIDSFKILNTFFNSKIKDIDTFDKKDIIPNNITHTGQLLNYKVLIVSTNNFNYFDDDNN